ncbi:MAG TPA: phosphoribosyltransferase family protein [Solirubrobacteraceae bacterium]|nr:phosphoribosyltransferase family protein [Solirubrobacteraceae bacterium]
MATPRLELRTFRDRRDAGRALAAAVGQLELADPVVLGLPRGGVPVAYEVARALGAPLDVLVVRKIGAPANPEFAVGAIAEAGVGVLDDDSVRRLMISHEELEHAIAQARRELRRRAARYRRAADPLPLTDRTVVIVDDGLATGSTARAAVRAVRTRNPARIIVAVPVGAPASVQSLRREADDVVCIQQPQALWAIGHWYEDFRPTTDAEVSELLRRAVSGDARGEPPDPPVPDPPVRRRVEIELSRAEASLAADLAIPERATGLVLFAHGSGSGRHSPRNRHVAELLNRAGQATLLLDLLTRDEERDRRNVFDVALLARRLLVASRWASARSELAGLPLGYFGASTGAAAALWAAAEPGSRVRAVVSRGGRPDLAVPRLQNVTAPVLLIVGGHDDVVLDLNRRALAHLRCPAELAVVPGATHLFEEPGALEHVARLAAGWFSGHLGTGA